MKQFMVPIGCMLALALTCDVAGAQGRGSGSKPKISAGGPSKGSAARPAGTPSHGSAKTSGARPTVQGNRPAQAGTKPVPGAGHKTAGKVNSGPKAKTTTAAQPKAKANTTTAAKKTTTTKNAASGSSTSPTVTTATNATTTNTTGAAPLTKVQQKLQQNTKLASKLETRLPKGTDLMAAAEGFRNLGQFVAAVNVSNNLALDFVQLKAAMVDGGMSLGQAIQNQNASLDGATEAARAQRDADALVKTTEPSTTVTNTTVTATASATAATTTSTTGTTTSAAKSRKTKGVRP